MIATALAESQGFDGYKRVKGHKRHIVVETMGIPLPVQVTEANASDSQTALGITVGSFLLLGHYPKATGRRRLWGNLGWWLYYWFQVELEIAVNLKTENFQVLPKW